MFQDKISGISEEMAVLSIDKTLYDSGFSVTGSDIDCDYLYEVFYDAVYAMDGDCEEDENSDCCIYTFRGKKIKEYVMLALKYGRLNGIANDQNFWIKRLENFIDEEMRSIRDYSYDYDYNIVSVKRAFLKVYIYPEFYQTVSLIRAVSCILDFIRQSSGIIAGQIKKQQAEKKRERAA